MDGFGGNRQRLARAHRGRRFAVYLVLERPLEHVDDLLARMPVSDRRRVRVDLDAVLDDLTPRHAEVVPLEVGAGESRNLLCRHGSSFQWAAPACEAAVTCSRYGARNSVSAASRASGACSATQWPLPGSTTVWTSSATSFIA